MSISTEPREFPNSTEAWRYLKKKAAATTAQERREKFAMDIELIKSRKQSDTIAITPVPHDEQEAYYAKLESNGIWRQVFQSMTSLSDITSAYFANGMFGDHLEEKRISMLLPLFFGVIRNLIYNDERYENLLSRKDFLNIRLVSKAWNMAADEQFLAPVAFSEPGWHLRWDNLTGKMIANNLLLSTVNIKLATDALRTSRSSSSLLKFLDISVKDDDAMSSAYMKTFISKLGELLDVHGEHVWCLHLAGPWDYKHLWNLVSRMPNLKELHIACWEREGENVSENEERMLLTQFPFPAIPSLERLVFFEVQRSYLWFLEIVSKNPNLKTVMIAALNPGNLVQLYPALANLRLESLHICVGGDSRMRLADVQPMGQMQWPLKFLNLSWIDECGVSPSVDSCALFRILSQFNDTLEEIHVGAIVPTDYGKEVAVHFPKLKVVDIGWVKVLFKVL